MNKLVILPLAAVALLGLSACSKTETTENVTVNDTSINAADVNSSDNAVSDSLENGTNTADALTNG